VEQHYTWMRPAFEKAWDPIWATATRLERVKLFRKACLAAVTDAEVKAEMEGFDDETWGVALDTFESELKIVVQSQTERGGTWVDVALFQGQHAVNEAMAAGITDPMSVEALRIYRQSGPRVWIATKPRRGRWVLHTKTSN
jgi:hypothetical protein